MKKITSSIMAITCVVAVCSSHAFANNPRYGTYYPPSKVHCIPQTNGVAQCDIPNDVAPYLIVTNPISVEGDYYLNYAMGTVNVNTVYKYVGTDGMIQLRTAYTGMGPDTSTGEWTMSMGSLVCTPTSGPSCPFTNVPFMPAPKGGKK